MHQILGKFEGPIYALLRIVSGFLFMCHGGQKLLGWFGGTGHPLDTLATIAGAIELFGGALILIGLFASWAAFLSSGLMAVAYFMAHQGQGALPIQNGGELAALYAFVFLYIAARGAGPLSVASAVNRPSLG